MESKHIKLFTDTTIIINGLKIRLEENDISYLIKDRFESSRLGGFGESLGSVEIYVLDKDFENAEKILDNYRKKIYS